MKKRDYNFKKDINRGSKYTKLEIIESMKKFFSLRGNKSFTQKQYNTWEKRVLCSSQISKRFGGWAKIMQEAGLEPYWGKKKDIAEMVEIYMDCWQEQDDMPTEKIFLNHLKKIDSWYTLNMYKHHFGSWRRLAQRIIDFHDEKISEKQLLEKYQSGKKARRPIPLSLRNEVLLRDGGRCKQCGRSAEKDKVPLEVDHIVPVSEGGGNDKNNLQTLCFDCNRGKSNSTYNKKSE